MTEPSNFKEDGEVPVIHYQDGASAPMAERTKLFVAIVGAVLGWLGVLFLTGFAWASFGSYDVVSGVLAVTLDGVILWAAVRSIRNVGGR